MSQPDRRSLLVGACRQRQEQILSKLAQVRQRLQLSNGLDNQRWVKVESDLLTRHDQEEQRIQRLMSESHESATPSFEVRLEEEAPAESSDREPGRGQFEALQQQLKRAQTLLAQKTQLCLNLQAQVAAPSADLQELRSQNAALSAQLEEQRKLTSQKSELASELAVMTESVVRLQEKNAGLQAELEQKNKSSQEDLQMIEDLRQQMESLSADLLLKSLAAERLQADLDLKGGQASRSQEELLLKVQGLEARLQQSSGLQSRFDETEAELLRVTQEHSAVSTLAEQRALQIEQLQREIDQLFQEVSNTHQSVQQQYEEAQGFKSQLQAEQEQSRLALADLRQQLSRAGSAEAPALEAGAPAEVSPLGAEVTEPETAPQAEAVLPESAAPSRTEDLDLESIPELVLDDQEDFDFASVELDPPPDWLLAEKPTE